jgi:hypothetical protein
MFGQQVADLFNKSDVKITYLGIDYSQVKLIGSFNQFAEAGATGPKLIKSKYFDSWNNLVINESKKYDIAWILRKETINSDIVEISELNSKTGLETIEAENTPNYTTDFIKNYVSKYNFSIKEGFGIVFIAESLNKNNQEGILHFVVFNLKTNEVVIQERLIEPAGGIGLRNYWARTIFEAIRELQEDKYKIWKKKLTK